MGGFPIDRLSALTLGTAAFGMEYGVARPDERLDEAAVFALLDAARKGGISVLDTAPVYGEAEARIGRWCRETQAAPAIITKLPRIEDHDTAAAGDAVRRAVHASLARLGRSSLDGLMAHAAEDYARAEVRDAFAALIADGTVRAIGASVYDPDEVFRLLDAGPPDIVQLPANVLDRRMAESGALGACRDAGVTVFARSVFLQGALLMPPDALPTHLSALAPVLTDLSAVARAANTSVASLALRSVRDLTGVASVVVGVHDDAQLAQVIDAAAEPTLPGSVIEEIATLADRVPRDCADPRLWPR